MSEHDVHRMPSTAARTGELPRQLTNSVGMRFVLVPAGRFWMGGGGGQAGDQQVAIPQDFYLGVFPVTQGQWQAVMGNNPSHFSRNGDGKNRVTCIADADLRDFPVEQVSWEDAQAFLQHLNEREKERGLVYRLPTETEWEYACRGGATSKEDCSYHFYLDQPSNTLCSTQANFDGSLPDGAARGPYLYRTKKVGSYPANRLGICDMHGNVWEWCEDAHEEGVGRGLRGGAWNYTGAGCRAAVSTWDFPSERDCHYGFRAAAAPSGSQ
jgi:formylglycine-generating enzyme required for sulfatase activity